MTKASGDASDTIGRPVDNGQLGFIDPECRAIGLHLYDGLLKIIPVDPSSGQLGAEMCNTRLEELNVIVMAFLAACPTPTVALLYEDAKHARHIKTYALSMRSKVRGRKQRGCSCICRACLHGHCVCIRAAGHQPV